MFFFLVFLCLQFIGNPINNIRIKFCMSHVALLRGIFIKCLTNDYDIVFSIFISHSWQRYA